MPIQSRGERSTDRPIPVAEEVSIDEMEDKPGLKAGTLVVVEAECKFAADRSKATIVIESIKPSFPEAIDELQSNDSTRLAQGYAAIQGVSSPCLNGILRTFAVNEDGVPLEQVADAAGKPFPPRHKKMQPAAYRVNVPIARKM